jgi:hypothetical protein
MGGFLGSFGQGAGGFLSGLGGRLSDMWHGTTPELAPGGPVRNMGTMLPANGPGTGGDQVQYTPPPTLTGNTTGGLLSKLQDPDSRGLTFGDKLFAAGSVLQGDSGGAATYLQNQRSNAQNENDRMTARRNQLAGAKAFRDNIGPNGEMNFQGYANAMGDEFDPEKAVSLRKALAPKYSPVSLAGGGAAAFNEATGRFDTQIAGAPKQPGKYRMIDPNGDPNDPGNWEVNPLEAQLAQQVARGRRIGAPLAPRAGPKPAAPHPTPTGRSF